MLQFGHLDLSLLHTNNKIEYEPECMSATKDHSIRFLLIGGGSGGNSRPCQNKSQRLLQLNLSGYTFSTKYGEGF